MTRLDIRELLCNNSYAGRGIIIGQTADAKHAAIAYFIMGRSENSRNRVFLEDGAGLLIKPYDESKVEDPSLIIYSPLRVLGDKTIVTNGDQTDTIFEALILGGSFESALQTRVYEPDAPNFTPRISGIVELCPSFSYKLNILKLEDSEAMTCGRYTYSYEPVAGKGHFIHTYIRDGNPLPSFCGEPEPVSIGDDIDAFGDLLWESLNAENKVSLAVRFIDLEDGSYITKIYNKNE